MLSAKSSGSVPPKKKRPINLGMWWGPNLGPNGGLIVNEVDKFGSGPKAGIVVGDEIVAWNGTVVSKFTTDTLANLLDTTGAGKTLVVKVARKGSLLEVPMVLVEKRKVLSLDIEEVD